MNIAQYINDLLIDNDCVIIPGLGGFVANNQSAVVLGTAHVRFMPPTKQLLFNVKLHTNDGLLVSKLSAIHKLSFKQAEEQVLDFVHGIKKQLHQTGSFSIDNIGVLFLNTNGSIEFQPTVDTNLFADSFGLSSFMFPQLNYGIRAREHVSFKQSAPKRHVVLQKTVKRVAVVVPLLLLLAVLPTVYLRNIQQSSFSFFDTAKTEAVEGIKSSSSSVTHRANKKIVVSEPQMTYHIIIGCYRNCSTAQKLSEVFRSKGYSASVLSINDLYKVSLQSYTDIQEANKALSTFQDANPQFADSWIMGK